MATLPIRGFHLYCGVRQFATKDMRKKWTKHYLLLTANFDGITEQMVENAQNGWYFEDDILKWHNFHSFYNNFSPLYHISNEQ